MDRCRAVVCRELGRPGRIAVEDVPAAAPGPGEIRIKVRAAGVNFPDLLMVQGLYQYRPPIPFVPGLEVAGDILAAAPETGWAPGQSVIAHLRSGGWAEEVVVPSSNVMRLPAGYDYAEGAAFYAASITAYHGLVTRTALKAGETLLVVGAAGGVGLATVQLGARLGATVVAAASSPDKLAHARQAGAAHLVDTSAGPIDDAVREITGGRGVDVVFDPVGVDPKVALRAVAWGGRVAVVGFAGGSIPDYAANRLLLRGASLIGVRAGEFGRRFPDARSQELDRLLALAEAGDVRPLVSARLPLEAFETALDLLSGRRAIGRIVLEPPA